MEVLSFLQGSCTVLIILYIFKAHYDTASSRNHQRAGLKTFAMCQEKPCNMPRGLTWNLYNFDPGMDWKSVRGFARVLRNYGANGSLEGPHQAPDRVVQPAVQVQIAPVQPAVQEQ